MIQFVLGYGHSEFTRVCIESIYENTPPEEINLVVWENHSPDPLRADDINPANTVLLRMDKNYGCSTALNSMMKDFGAGLDQDVIYLSNDHYVFPGWIAPLLENRRGFHSVSPMHPFGLTDLHGQLASFVDFRDPVRRDYLDHPESRKRIKEFLHLIYGDDLERFLREKIAPLPEVACTDQFWAGCFFLRKDILREVAPFRTDRGLAGDEDALWFEDNLEGRYRTGVYSRSYVHHFQSVTVARTHLSMDHPGEDYRSPVPDLTDDARNRISEGIRRMERVLVRLNAGR